MKFFIVTVLAFSLAACYTEPPELTTSERIIVDSIFRDRVNVVSPQVDSLCGRQRDSLIKVYADSMMKERLEEIAKQLNRIRNEIQ